MDNNQNILKETKVETQDDVEIDLQEDQVGLMEKPFDPTMIKIETKTPSLDTLIRRLRGNEIEMNTETYFQRKDDLWDKTKQSRLIESILIRFPLPAFFFDASDNDKWLVVDGLQRLSSIRNFVVNRSQPLAHLEFLTDLNGKYWDDLPVNLQRSIEEAEVVIYKIMPGTPTDVKFNIFKRINTGGLVLESQEIRHALFQGKPAKFIYDLANTEAFRKATQGRIRTERMLDRDFTNRFLAFYVLGVKNYGTKEYGQDLDTYMNKVMEEIYNKTDEELEKVKDAYILAMKLSKQIFGTKAFRKVTKSYNRLPPINKALFEVLSTQFGLLTPEQAKNLLKNKEEFKQKLQNELTENHNFFMSVTTATGHRNKVRFRHCTIRRLIKESITN